MRDALHILVTCTKRKSRPPEAALMMRKIRARDVAVRFEEWTSRLTTGSSCGLPAGELYAGDHWQIAAELPRLAGKNGFRANLWVISAGYGLLHSSTTVRPYSAAFSPGHADCVTPASEPQDIFKGFADWWRLMTAWPGPNGVQPRSLVQLAKQDSTARIVLIASELYLKAVWSDLLRVHKFLAGKASDRLLIISAGTREFGPLEHCALPLDARLQERLSGARRSLNVRAARQVLGRLTPEIGFGQIRKNYARMLASAPPLETILRKKLSDPDVIEFVQSALRHAPKPSATGLLRQLRDSGFACEQKRFGQLFKQAQEIKHAKASK